MTTNEKAPGACDTECLQNDSPNVANCATVTRQPGTAYLIAVLTAKGHTVHKCTGGGYMVSKYGLTYFAADDAGLSAFAKKLGAVK